MSTPVIVTFLIVFIPVLISRYLHEQALKDLDPEMKLKLLDAFSNQRKYSGIVMLPLFIGYFLLLQFLPRYSIITISVFGVSFLIYFIASRIMNYRKLQKLGAPDDYLKVQRVSILMITTGFVLVGVQIFYVLNFQ